MATNREHGFRRHCSDGENNVGIHSNHGWTRGRWPLVSRYPVDAGSDAVRRDSGGAGDKTAVSSMFTLGDPPRRFCEPRASTASTKMRRIICAAMAKDCDAPAIPRWSRLPHADRLHGLTKKLGGCCPGVHSSDTGGPTGAIPLDLLSRSLQCSLVTAAPGV
jgi:hypothetical protein